ncbi:MAG: hypothetical protein JWN85_3944 [Gammaproteobacteria bacterium]|nr:hypothetical protein [Gammaproteobacteria bacterium]
MVRLTFEAAANLATPTIGPAPLFRLQNGLLTCGRNLEPVAHYDVSGWRLGTSDCYTRMRVHEPVLIQFESERGERTGSERPLGNVSIVDGTIWAGDSVIADLKEHNPCWTAPPGGTVWAALTLEDALQGAKRSS